MSLKNTRCQTLVLFVKRMEDPSVGVEWSKLEIRHGDDGGRFAVALAEDGYSIGLYCGDCGFGLFIPLKVMGDQRNDYDEYYWWQRARRAITAAARRGNGFVASLKQMDCDSDVIGVSYVVGFDDFREVIPMIGPSFDPGRQEVLEY